MTWFCIITSSIVRFVAIWFSYICFLELFGLNIQILFGSWGRLLFLDLRISWVLWSCLVLMYALLQALLGRLLLEQLLLLPTAVRRELGARVLNNTFTMRDVTYVTRSVTHMANAVIDRNSIIFIHAYAHKRIRWPVLLRVRTVLLISLKRIDALGVDLLDLVLRNIFQTVRRCIVLARLRIRFIMVLLNQIIAEFDLLRFWNRLSLIIILTCKIDVILNVRKFWLVVLILRAGLRVLDGHIGLQVPVVQSLKVLLLIIWHVYLTIECRFTQYTVIRCSSLVLARSFFESRNRLQFAISVRRSNVRLLLCDLRQTLAFRIP